jgi:hypothetical protein
MKVERFEDLEIWQDLSSPEIGLHEK